MRKREMAIAGAGYVGLAHTMRLARHHDVGVGEVTLLKQCRLAIVTPETRDLFHSDA